MNGHHDLRLLVSNLCSGGAIPPFDVAAVMGLSSVAWDSAAIGHSLLPAYFDDQSDQGCRSSGARERIVNWLEANIGEMKGRQILDLFSGRGACTVECLDRGAIAYVGVDINPAVVAAAQTAAPQGANFVCADAVAYAANSEIERFDVIFVLYECLNAIGKLASESLLRRLRQRCAHGAWIVGDVRPPPFRHQLEYRLVTSCAYLSAVSGGSLIEEYGSAGGIFGHRYIALDESQTRVTGTSHSMLELYERNELDRLIIQGAGFSNFTIGQPLLGLPTDVPECSGNFFFAAQAKG